MDAERDPHPALPLMDISTCCSDGLREPLAREEADQLARVLKAVADPVRLQLLALIRAQDEACACDLTEPVGVSQPTVSHHLKVLTEAGLLRREQRGRWAWFHLNPQRFDDLARLFATTALPPDASDR